MRVTAASIIAATLSLSIAQADELRIGFMATFTGPGANLGQHLRDGFLLGVEHVGGKVGGLETRVIVSDDQLKPDIARQEVDKLLTRDKVHFVVGVVFSNVLMAIYKPVIESGAFLISANAGPSPIAGQLCSERFFSTSWQNDQTHGVVGKYAQDKGFRNVLLLAPNYQAGKDALNGFKRYYKGTIVDEIYTPLGSVDFSAELAKIQSLKPEAVYAFMPGGSGIALIKQYAQAGLNKRIPFLSAFTVDDTSLPAVGEVADGMISASQWAADLPNPANQRFVAAFRARYGYVPSYFAAQAYDAALFLDAGIKAAGGRLDDKTALRDALRKVNFPSVRGSWKLNTNHFPISDFYLVTPGKLADGTRAMVHKELVFPNYADENAKDCPMRW
ncbi:MAG: ABC transporter substrate-binding protein [Geminicoccaceae bacterium]|nr:MAG: ABC transporter substrate-binding protein [Geminicoccaceae bacterium]